MLANARLVLADEVVTGALARRGRAHRRDRAPARGVPRGAEDSAATSSPRGSSSCTPTTSSATSSRGPACAGRRSPAILAHDAELAGSGITTVFDALRVGSLEGGGRTGYGAYARPLADAILRLHGAGALRISHRLHLRAETCSETLAEEIAEFGPDDRVGIVSLMDHTPGQRQFADIEKLKLYAMGRRDISEEEFRRHVADMTALGERNVAGHRGGGDRRRPPLRGHDGQPRRRDDAHVAASADAGARIAEFPTSRRRRPPRARAGHRGDDGGAEPRPRRLAFGQRRGGCSSPRPGSSTSSPPTTPRRASSSARCGSGSTSGDLARRPRDSDRGPRPRRRPRRPRPARGRACAPTSSASAWSRAIRCGRRSGSAAGGSPERVLSYQHGYHAGGPADLHKHIVLAELLARLTAKPRGIGYFETHAGRGLYDLAAPEALKTGEAAQGIARIAPDPATPFGAPSPRSAPRHGPAAYPGSPLLARTLLRPQDRLTLFELHPAEHAALAATLGRARAPPCTAATASRASSPASPPPTRRGLVLVDPSYEVKGEYAAAAALRAPICSRNGPRPPSSSGIRCCRRRATASSSPASRRSARRSTRSRFDPPPARGMTGSGLALVGAPHGAAAGRLRRRPAAGGAGAGARMREDVRSR